MFETAGETVGVGVARGIGEGVASLVRETLGEPLAVLPGLNVVVVELVVVGVREDDGDCDGDVVGVKLGLADEVIEDVIEGEKVSDADSAVGDADGLPLFDCELI